MTQSITISPPKRLRGVIETPGDKSISHRAVIFNAVAEGNARVTHFLTGADCLSTIACVQALGVKVERDGDAVRVYGAGLRGLQEPAGGLDVRLPFLALEARVRLHHALLATQIISWPFSTNGPRSQSPYRASTS